MSHVFRFIGTKDTAGRWNLSTEELHHIRVVGLGRDDRLELIDGRGSFCEARIRSISSKSIELEEVAGSFKTVTPPPFKLGVVTGILKNTSDLLSTLTEIGVDAIYLFTQSHSKKDLTDRLKQKFQSILRSSTKQSKRYFIPDLYFFSSLKECLDHLNSDPITSVSKKIVLDDTSSTSILDLPVHAKDSFLLFTGTELGFTFEEESLIKEQTTTPVNIGSFILRSINASTCASMIMNLKIEKVKNQK